jgi:hypothetical protein
LHSTPNDSASPKRTFPVRALAGRVLLRGTETIAALAGREADFAPGERLPDEVFDAVLSGSP